MKNLEILVYNQNCEELDIDFVDLSWGLGNTMIVVIKDKNNDGTSLFDREDLLKKIKEKEFNKPRDYYAPVTNGYCFDW